MTTNKTLGSTLIIIGTTIGAGVLALPLATAGLGFYYAVILMIMLWILMCYTALLTLEVNLAFPRGSSFSSMAKATLGTPGKIIATAAMLILFYALTAAYITGGSQLITENLHIHFQHAEKISALIFTIILGGFVFWSTRAVDYANRILFTIKIIAFIAMLALLIGHVDLQRLEPQPTAQLFILAAAPIVFTSFGFHGSIPSIVNYVGISPKKLRKVLIIGSMVPLILYIIFELTTLGTIPRTGPHSLAALTAQGSSVGEFIHALSLWVHSPVITALVNIFSDIAVTTSFLGVTLGLFDFIADATKRHNTKTGRLQSALMTFIPPLVFALFYPKGFIIALGYAAIALAVLAVLLPVLMVHKVRILPDLSSPYKVKGSVLILTIVFLAGLLIIALQIASAFNLLPVFH
ncbi:Tyrosine permease [Piscirickettsia salmonis]|uniref:Aromatic amino acid permease n=1 Tax=Piscirickettsia salmonis TaxID=1238 RepID=A0A1L6TBS9_PISSA|nr:aromatic amino acid transport family protein [Piscirickettsia salmonis]AKP73849.1 tyrosine-specific transport protein [Piscirickettsia salmonis LF-89 = ATCC VR-1361]ALB22660.1 tyrosine-specific transport protein [Piscirickettsia salmonis]ALY02671.1 tyrosine-specific transport protein [Piscirickettsia salmonis]AMA42215.1 tyrosine-specific transport protein [Piscirickettsia salmonis]AOS34690.1 tyrosine-specific transport protein [Piscirickettsia salmonis]